jgi:hypothetical protein
VSVAAEQEEETVDAEPSIDGEAEGEERVRENKIGFMIKVIQRNSRSTLTSCREEAPNELNIADGEIESNWDTVTDNFDNMELKPELLRGIYAYG